ncbi:Heat shock protein 75 kDa, mitochondrial [Schistosoma japonicum]|nr:Heat shock protein 75 kDa, mitochondrial [Schistosoma japonicum]KAH8871044.1 Heat shock protein 75 kDa, mitochondrial [Schistosoma japonicum]
MSVLCNIFRRFPSVLRNSKQNVRTLYSHKLFLQKFVPYSTAFKTTDDENPKYTIIGDNERSCGPKQRVGFQAETQKLLNIVAKSLYSDKEVFVRELISNASDAIERLRFQRLSGQLPSSSKDVPLEIHIKTDEERRILIIQDTGIGMSRNELEKNLGTIAHSGSREFVSNMAGDKNSNKPTDIIGQFGVGFYACFMVADKVDVYSRSHMDSSPQEVGSHWSSTGLNGEYEISDAENVNPGTKIVLHLNESASEFAKHDVLERILRKYSNFVGTPIYLNGQQINVIEPIWTKNQSEVSDEEHTSFYQYLCDNKYDSPRYTFAYQTDAPINLRVLLYVPNWKPSIFDMARDPDNGVALYSRRVMIMNRTEALLPKWLRFLRGVVDSEDIPLNLSRELLQDNSLIRRINRLVTVRFLKFLSQQVSRETDKFISFLDDFGLYLKEGLVIEGDQQLREEIAKLLRWESSALPAGQTTCLDEYSGRMQPGQRNIYFLSSPSRQLAESSPYLEAARKKNPNVEVLFLYEPYDELVLMQLSQYDKKSLTSVESMIADDLADTDSVGPERQNCLKQYEASELVEWAEKILGPKVKKVKVTQRLSTHPCFVSVREAGAMRHFLRTSLADRPAEERYRVIEPILEFNPEHELVRYLYNLVHASKDSEQSKDYSLAVSILNLLYDAAMAQAGLLDDIRGLASRMTDLVGKLIKTAK